MFKSMPLVALALLGSILGCKTRNFDSGSQAQQASVGEVRRWELYKVTITKERETVFNPFNDEDAGYIVARDVVAVLSKRPTGVQTFNSALGTVLVRYLTGRSDDQHLYQIRKSDLDLSECGEREGG